MAEQQGPSQTDVINTILLVLDIVLLQVKFWFLVVLGIVKSFLPKEEENVNGKVVLITGTGHGMGKEMAQQYGKLGAKVICLDINEANNAKTVKQILANGGQAVAYTCNIVNRNDVNELADKIKKEHGFVHVIVNNAGIMPCHPLLEHTETEIRTLFDVNVVAHFWIIQAFLPQMLERNEGHIVALSSCAGLFGLANLVPYCGTKFAVRGIMISLHEELRRLNPQNNIKLTTIYPYMVDTGLCKNPRTRFAGLMKMVTPTEAAASIISAQRTGLEEASLPRHYLYLDIIGRMLPKTAMRLVNDFLDTGVDSDK